MRATLLHAYTPGNRIADQAETTSFLAHHAADIEVLGIDVQHATCVLSADYEYALRKAWGCGRDLIVLEQDLVPTMEQLADIASCDQALCAYAYQIYPVSTALPEPVYVHRQGTQWIRQGADWADLVGLGLTRFSGTAQAALPLSEWGEVGGWVGLDTRLSMMFQRLAWPKYRYTGAREATLPTLGVAVQPGKFVRLDADLSHPEFERVAAGEPMRFHVHWPKVKHNHQ